MQNFERFYVSQAGVLIRDNKCLILELAKYPGEWCLPGGRIDEGENSVDAFKREIKEEIDMDTFRIHKLINYDIFYTKRNKPFCAIIQYIENNESPIKLSDEHLNFKWVNENEVKNYSFVWEHIPDAIEKGFEYYREIKN